ncbi:MAG TPA: hypothetical protein VJ276_08640 [Thermoanaerobaculia bacterium]|nr:hypothetical protein [Thermoanaerobaculia bacterium]
MKRLIVFLLVLAFACKGESPTAPTPPHGRLSGLVTITPAPQPSEFAARKVLVYDEAKTRLLFTVDLDSRGFYFIDLVPAKYTIDLQGPAGDRTSDVPATVEILANVVTRHDINISR